ncbi:MAG: adventurous gliding motility protein CglE [Myxococcales bacterium]|nr:adventurous gliding motility protein CglE [Myxococcales bacterium]MCB9642894.1 adventurous gliding motility protein CglE [Myxococcales bacterium]
MLRRILFGLFAFSVLFGVFAPRAQAQYLEEDPKSYIRKGFFMSASYGLYVFALKPSALSRENGAQASLIGTLGGLELGYDVADIFSLQFSFLAPAVTGDPQAGGGNGDYLFQLGATIHFLRLNQLYIYAKLGAGVSLSLPDTNNNLGLIVHLGLGLKYYTRARHLSVGLEVIGLLRPLTFGGTSGSDSSLSLGIGVMPTLTYTF